MSHNAVANITAELVIQPGAVVSKVIERGKDLNVTVFAFDSGEGLTEHASPRTALVQVLSGRMGITADGTRYDATPGFWMKMSPDTPHSLEAVEPSLLLLTLV